MFDCIGYVSEQYNIPSQIVEAVISVESNGKNVVSINRDKSYDIGVMQINSWWLPILNKININRDDLLNVCTNISVGSWLISYEYKHFKNWQDALASYNAGRSKFNKPYAQKYANKVLNRVKVDSILSVN